MINFDNPMDRIKQVYYLKLINYKLQAKNQSMIEHFKFDTGYQVDKILYLLQYPLKEKPLNINPFKHYKIDKYVNYILIVLL